MAGPHALLGIGTLSELEVFNPATKRSTTMRLRNRWLAWDTKRRAFHICVPKSRKANPLPAGVLKAHRKFHSAASGAALMADVPNPIGTLKQVGLLKALVYHVPSQVRSPEKNTYAWHHAFGDTGHKGGATYPERVMPALMRDSKGNLFIKRRKGNIFRVDTWLRG